jgi:hypothetical protein
MPDPSTPTNDGALGALRAQWAREVRTRLASLHLSPTREAEIVDELTQHLADRYRELIAGGRHRRRRRAWRSPSSAVGTSSRS